MKRIIFTVLFLLTVMYPFKESKSSASSTTSGKQIHTDMLVSEANKLTKRNVHDYLYHLTQDSAKTDLYLRILLNESGLKSELATEQNNICGMRNWEGKNKYFVGLNKSKYCIYPHWRYSVKDLVEYMEHYGRRAWYFRFKDRFPHISTKLD
jgi:uncharacterized FlgJ-related protein